MAWISRKRRTRPEQPTTGVPATTSEKGESDAHRIARLCTWCIEGQLAAAELELHSWQRQGDCPPAARVLLASSFANRGEIEKAIVVLPRPAIIRNEADALAATTLISLLVCAGLTDTARIVLRQLHQESGHRATVADWIDTMRMPGTSALPPTADATADLLAAELIRSTHVIPSLIAAQKVDPDAGAVHLLRRAILRVSHDVADESDELMVCQAMADLALLSSDEDDARRWAHRGLRINSYAASLAMVLSRVADDLAVGPPATQVLEAVIAEHPTYPDVRAALIRREHAEGHVERARMRLSEWLEQQPAHPIAAQLSKELAA